MLDSASVSADLILYLNNFFNFALLSPLYVLQLQEKLQPHAIIPLPSKNIRELWKVNVSVRNTKVITLANHKAQRKCNERIRTLRK